MKGQKRFHKQRSQTAGEYLLIIAVLLLVAMVAIFIIRDYFMGDSDREILKSHLYWSSTQPIAVTGYRLGSGSLMHHLQVCNYQSGLLIKNVSVVTSNNMQGYALNPLHLAQRQCASLPVYYQAPETEDGREICEKNTYSLRISITYVKDESRMESEFVGQSPLMDYCQ